MKLYISGPMSYRAQHNFPAFHAVAKSLRKNGFDVVNPAELDEGTDTTGWKHSDYLKRDIRLLLDCDGVATLPEWQTSKGARMEVDVALGLNMPVMSDFAWIFSYESGGVTP